MRGEKPKYQEKILSHCHCFHHKFHIKLAWERTQSQECYILWDMYHKYANYKENPLHNLGIPNTEVRAKYSACIRYCKYKTGPRVSGFINRIITISTAFIHLIFICWFNRKKINNSNSAQDFMLCVCCKNHHNTVISKCPVQIDSSLCHRKDKEQASSRRAAACCLFQEYLKLGRSYET